MRLLFLIAVSILVDILCQHWGINNNYFEGLEKFLVTYALILDIVKK